MVNNAAYTIAVDFGTKRCGVATNDGLSSLAFPQGTYTPEELKSFLKKFQENNHLVTLVIGEARQLDNTLNAIESSIQEWLKWAEINLPGTSIERQDERFTSKIASQAIAQSGLPKKKRQNKALIDQTSAVLILQGYLERKDRL